MQKSVFKVFFSKNKENEWLNKLGALGYRLIGINDSNYTFEVDETKRYHYSIQYLDYSPFSDDATEYYQSQKENGTIPLVCSGNWVYFANGDGEIEPIAETYRRNALYYFWRILYFSFFTLLFSVICGYHAFAVKYLERVGYSGNGQIREMLEITDDGKTFEGLLNALKEVANFLLRLLNSYMKLWTNVFGESDAVAVISIAVPVILVLLAFLANYVNEFYTYKKLQRALEINGNNIILEEKKDAEQAI